jgi:2-oxoglutarate ferredoxin oxidoreductase subunit alpha
MRELIDGNEAIVRAALDAGCDFYAGYPITPATPILIAMSQELPRVGGTAIQTEDEIAAMGVCIGAVLAGARAMTATSGPGISLYSESIGAALMCEVPLVIVDCQRMGPATGGATTVAQGDVQFLQWGTSGGYQQIVLCPSTVAECYELTGRAFTLAERFRMPVFIAADKELVATRVTVDSSRLAGIKPSARKTLPSDETYNIYPEEQPGTAAPLAHFGGPHLVRTSTSSHDAGGYLIKDAKNMGKLSQHLWEKVNSKRAELEDVSWDRQTGADVLIISYGITAQAARKAVSIARQGGGRVSSLILRSLWPVPEAAIRTALSDIKRIFVVELNHGQYRREIERLASVDQQVLGVNRVDGRLITPEHILERV